MSVKLTTSNKKTMNADKIRDFSLIMDSMPGLSILVDQLGFVVHINKSAQCLVGYQESAILGKKIENLPFSGSCMVDSQTGQLHTTWFTLDGKTEKLEWTGAQLVLDNENCTFFSATNRDQTETTNCFEPSLESMHCGFCAIDENAKLMYANKIISEMTGYDPSELANMEISNLLETFEAEKWSKFWNSLGDGLFETHGKIRKKNGQIQFLSLKCRKADRHGTKAIHCLAQDRTSEHEKELEEQQRLDTIKLISEITFKLATSTCDKNLLTEQIGKLGSHFNLECIRLINLTDSDGGYDLFGSWVSDTQFEAVLPKNISKPILDRLLALMNDKRHLFKHTKDIITPVASNPIVTGIKTTLLIPIRAQDNLWGILAFISYKHEKDWKEWEIDLCDSFGASLSAVFDNIDRQNELQISERKLEESFQITPDAMAIINKNKSSLENCNIGLRKMIGKTGELTFADFHSFFSRVKDKNDMNTIAYCIHNDIDLKDYLVTFENLDGTESECMFTCDTTCLNDITYTIVNIRDVTELLKSKDQARENEESLSKVFELAPDPMFIIKDKHVVKANKMFTVMTGYPQSLIKTMKLSPQDIFEPEVTEVIWKSSTNNQQLNIPVKFTCADGKKVDFLMSMDTIMQAGEDSIICILHDITEIIKLQNQLKESLDRYETLAETVQNGILVLRGENVVYFNHACQEITGYGKDELTSRSFYDFFHPDSRQKAIDNYNKRQLQVDIDPIDTIKIVTKDGKDKILKYWIRRDKLDGLDVFIVSFSDVTDLVMAREKALQSSAMIETIISNVHDVLYIKDLQGRFQYFRWPKEEQSGMNFDNYIGKTLREVTPNVRDIEQVEKYRLQVVETGKPVKYLRTLQLAKWKAPTEYEILVTPLFDSKGEMVGTIGIAHNVTEEIMAKRKLEELENRLTKISETITDIIFQLDGEKIIYISPAIRTYGFLPEDLIGANVTSLFSFYNPPLLEEDGQKSFETSFKNSHGTKYDMEVKLTIDGSKITGVARDISERKNHEKAKRNFLKSVAHELRNPLTLVLGYSELMMSSTKNDKSLHDMASIIFDAAESEKKRLNEFFDLDKTIIDYNFEVTNTWKLLNSIYTKLWMLLPKIARQKHGTDKTSFGFFVSPDLKQRRISVDTNKFSEIIENLASNAVKYSPPDRIALFFSAKSDDGKLVIKFCDKGIGIDEKNIPLIFKPFYQINSPGYEQDGLGLGLANVKMHVQAHNGTIDVSSRLGEGTDFTLTFPLCD